MILFKRAAALRAYLEKQTANGFSTGFVPTMGALHEGHLSLIREAAAANDITVASIFVNPTQFNDPADFEKYPITIEKDIRLLETAGCDILFLPTVPEMYPGGTQEGTHYELGRLETMLEGKYRPGHFQGVCTIVHRLLNIVRPSALYIGQKDYQQCMVIQLLIGLTGMESIRVNISPTLREANGLAMSSRNARLSEAEKQLAGAIYENLQAIKTKLAPGDLQPLKQQALDALVAKGFKPDYIEIASAIDLAAVNYWDGKQPLVALAAVFLGNVRLIDNLLLNEQLFSTS